MVLIKQQELVWVKVRFSGLSESKIRPALIVSNNKYNEKTDDIVVCAVTSVLKEADYSIPIEQEDLSHGRLPVPSRIKADKIMQVEKKLVAKSFAKVNDRKFDAVIAEILKIVKRDHQAQGTSPL